MQKVEPQQEIKNQELEPKQKVDLKDGVSHTKRYNLQFNKETAEKVRLFCEAFFLDTSYFIVQTVRYELYFISDDVWNCEFDTFRRYFDLSKLIGNQSGTQKQDVNDKNQTVEANFHPLITKAIELYCEKTHWTPEEFIAHIMEYKIKDHIHAIKNNDYQFIELYFDFSDFIKLVDEIDKIDEDK